MVYLTKKASKNTRLLTVIALVMLGVLLMLIVNPSGRNTYASEPQDEYAELYAIDRGISIEEAQTRIGWQEKAAELNAKLTNTVNASDYGGLWIVGSTGRISIGIVQDTTTSATSQEAIMQEVENMGIKEAVDFTHVNYSQKHLVDAMYEINEIENKLLSNSEWPIQMSTKTDKNKLQIDIPDEGHLTSNHNEVISTIDEKYQDQIFYVTYRTKPQLEACNDYYCDNPLRGGVYIDDTVQACTAGPLLKRPSTGKVYILTAGHCMTSASSWSTKTSDYTDKYIGTITNSLYNNADPIDAMIINTANTEFASKTGKIFKRSGIAWSSISGYNDIPPTYDEAYDMATHSTSVVGERICISPAITGAQAEGGTCGEVESNGGLWDAGGVETFVHRAGYCSRSGDSGAPIFASSNKVKGIHRGADQSHGVCSHFKYYTPIATILIGFSNEGIDLEVW